MRALHNSRSIEYRAPFGALPLGKGADLILDVWEAPGASATLRTWIDGIGEARLPMDIIEQKSGGAEHIRFKATLEPAEPGIVWYQFIISDGNGHETRYGAQEGKMSGEGRLYDWEPPSFKLSVYDEAHIEDGSLDREARFRLREAIVDYLRDESGAPAFVEALDMLREDYPPLVFWRSLDLLGVSDRAHLMAQLAGVVDSGDVQHPDLADYHLESGRIGLAKGRLWCASLVQTLMADRLFIHPDENSPKESCPMEHAIAQWETVDFDCGNIAQNAVDLRRSLPIFEQGTSEWFAANDDVFGFWRRQKNGEAVCVLINASLQKAHDVYIPLENEAASEVIGGYAVPIINAADVDNLPAGTPRAERYARVHLYQLGSAALYFHTDQRFEKPLEPGLGVLAHITSLPSGKTQPNSASAKLGTLGESARSFIDWLAKAGIRYWQVLPVNPTDEYGSPYAGISAFAGSVLLLEDEFDTLSQTAPKDARAYKSFCKRESDWLEPYAAFMAIRQKLGGERLWQNWPKEYRSYSPELLKEDKELAAYAEGWRRAQFTFETQWKSLRSYANERGVQIIGDMPIYVSGDSADVWANPGIFQIADDGKPKAIAGCPPDSFAPEGQIWGNPLYNWNALQSNGYDWWMRRLERAFDLYDIVRLDHFIGFARYYAIPAGKKATEGAYRPGPSIDFFEKAHAQFGPLPIIAEDLGLITPAVRALVAACGFPGMDIVQFADGGNPLAGYQPRPKKIAYTGTHDNQTLVGYAATRYPEMNAQEAATELMEKVLRCDAQIAIVPLQDILGLDDEARMNTPGTSENNWIWQATAADIQSATPRLQEIARMSKGQRA